MDNHDLANFDENDQVPPPSEEESVTIPFDDSDPPPASSVSRKPLTLGASDTPKAQAAPKPQAPAAKPAAKPAARPASAQAAAVSKRVAKAVGSNSKIKGLKTFYTKLHPGALDFMDQQVTEWLKANPGVVIKRTNVAVGEVQAKKTEENIILCIWY